MPGSVPITVTSPSNAKYIIISLRVANIDTVMFEKGNRVAQLVIIPIINYELVEKLNTRGNNGLGSSGK